MSNIRNNKDPLSVQYQLNKERRRQTRRNFLQQIRINNTNNFVGKNPEIKLEQIKINNPFKKSKSEYDKDMHIKTPQDLYQRHEYSPEVNSYEGDLMFISSNPNLVDNIYLVLINMNTRYAYIRRLENKSTDELKKAFANLIYYGLRINSLKFDGERGIGSIEMFEFFDKNNIKIYSSPERFLNKVRIVDRFIRTLRDGYYNVTFNKTKTRDEQEKILQSIVTLYNNTYHSSIKMKPIEMTYDKEYQYINEMKTINAVQKSKQIKACYHDFVYGEPIKIYLDKNKTSSRYMKNRGNFINDAIFLSYIHGNVQCLYNNEVIEIPIWWCKPKIN